MCRSRTTNEVVGCLLEGKMGVQLGIVEDVTPHTFSNKENMHSHSFFLLNLCIPLIILIIDYEHFVINYKLKSLTPHIISTFKYV